jgi:hypothetical protein
MIHNIAFKANWDCIQQRKHHIANKLNWKEYKSQTLPKYKSGSGIGNTRNSPEISNEIHHDSIYLNHVALHF